MSCTKCKTFFEFTKRKFNKRSRNENVEIKCRIIFAGIKFKDWSTRNYSAFDALIQTNIQCTCPRTGSYIPLYLTWLWAGKTLEFRLLKTQFIIWTKLLVVIQSTVILFWDLLEYLPENRLDYPRMMSFINIFYSLNKKRRWWKQEKLPDYAIEITIKCLLAHPSGQFWIFLHYSFGFNYNHGIFISCAQEVIKGHM